MKFSYLLINIRFNAFKLHKALQNCSHEKMRTFRWVVTSGMNGRAGFNSVSQWLSHTYAGGYATLGLVQADVFPCPLCLLTKEKSEV